MSTASEITKILSSITNGDRSGADRLFKTVYGELRRLASHYLGRQRASHTLQPTALVHEAFLKLAKQKDVDWKGRSHFFAAGAQAMRHILVDHARTENRQKRGGSRQRISLNEDLTISTRREEDVLAVDEALNKLSELNPVQAKIVELRFFAGMTVEEVAEALDMSKRSVERHWTMIRAWLRRELADEADS